MALLLFFYYLVFFFPLLLMIERKGEREREREKREKKKRKIKKYSTQGHVANIFPCTGEPLLLGIHIRVYKDDSARRMK